MTTVQPDPTLHPGDPGDGLHCYFSGALGGKMIHRIIDICQDRLLSCHGPYFGVAKRWCAMSHDHPKAKTEREILLDSGAFSAWSKGGEAHLSDVMRSYAEIINRYGDSYKAIYLINLDKIPGQRGRTATLEEIDEAMKISDQNFEILTKEFGPRVLPVFHQDETVERLREVVAQNPGYICISPRNDVAERPRREWSQRAHEACKGTPTHGLAATGVKMMTEVPWRSVDSASWTQLASYGKVMICVGERMFVANVSSDSSAKRVLGQHLDSFPEPEKDALVAALETIGVTVEEVRTSYDTRAYVNLHFYGDFVRRNNHYKGAPVQQTLFAL